ncbi:MAG: HPr(Ser) kinase/phosphatase [Candidatus Eisenbacteria bacterium]|uniref:HPr kinase/phosphorylase n=1 Tax=Eiseniibacteriota bacterium TaxID=2212470 RepID=A0A938BRS5_UNCEI|nr:HPr(Ser) kinase/phosphatase [Candidatus Eisenbacteria bacterium]
MIGMTVAAFYERARERCRLRLLSHSLHSRSRLVCAEINRPQLALTGYMEDFLWDRLQILGRTEVNYLEKLEPRERGKILSQILGFAIPCVVLPRGLQAPEPLVLLASQNEVPLFGTEMETIEFVSEVSAVLEEAFAPATTVHGSLVDVYGVGLLLTGRSAIGKSETALDLVERGHRLVADDIVTIRRRRSAILIGSGNELLRHCMEIRGLGIIDVQSIFGIRAIRGFKRVEVEVKLQEWNADERYERLGLQERETAILGVTIPLVEIPIFPGKNITVIAEAVALNYLVKAYGYHPAARFSDNLLEVIRRKRALSRLAEGDSE